MRRERRHELQAWLATAIALSLAPLTTADVIFRVPEVLVRHAAVPRAVGTGRANTASSNSTAAAAVAKPNDHDSWNSDDGRLDLKYEEYFVEHEISAVDARKAALQLNLDDIPATRPGCGPCSRREFDYCETRMMADHCCCELRYFPEPLPWLPHTCYMGPNRCKPLAHDCARYARLRDCCCYRKLAERWKSILSNSTRVGMSGVSLLLLSMLLFVAYL